MKETRIGMGMPISVEVVGENAREGIDGVFEYFTTIDERFSTYKDTSEVSRMNAGALAPENRSAELSEILMLAERTKQETGGYFDIRRPAGGIDPSGVVKGWAIKRAAEFFIASGYTHFCIDVGGDVAMSGTNGEGKPWSVGIRNPFNHEEIVKVIYPDGRGVATSGSAVRGNHIYDPHNPEKPIEDIVSITVVGPDVLEADRFATAAFAMGKEGVTFIESLPGFEAYSIDNNGIATMTSGFSELTHA